MPLTDTAIKNAKPGDKPYKLSDEKGLYVLIQGSGKYFRMNYRFAGKRKTLALGVYPDTSLKKARELRDAARQNIANGVDPSSLKKSLKRALEIRESNTFEAIAREYVCTKAKGKWSEKHTSKVLRRLERDVFPVIGGTPITEVSVSELLFIFRRIADRGAIDCCHRAKQDCSKIFRHAIQTERAQRDPAADLRGALPEINRNNFASITEPRKMGELLRAIDGYSGYLVVKYALQLAPLVFVRPGELRRAEWSEINFDRQEWRIPAVKMKMKSEHIVPLSSQAMAILQNLHPFTGHGLYLFPSVRTPSRAISDGTLNAALRRLGFTIEEMTAHGFRSMASTSLHEQGWASDVIERQLSHQERNSVKAAYNHAEHLPERRKMMQAWADHLDGLKAGERIGQDIKRA